MLVACTPIADENAPPFFLCWSLPLWTLCPYNMLNPVFRCPSLLSTGSISRLWRLTRHASYLDAIPASCTILFCKDHNDHNDQNHNLSIVSTRVLLHKLHFWSISPAAPSDAEISKRPPYPQLPADHGNSPARWGASVWDVTNRYH